MDHTQRKVIRKPNSRIDQVQYELDKTIEKIQKKEDREAPKLFPRIKMLKRKEKRAEVREKRNIILQAKKEAFLHFYIKDPLSIIWEKEKQRFILRSPFYFSLERYLYGNPQPRYTHNNLIKQQRKSVFMHLPGLKIISITNFEFQFEPCEKYVGLLRNNPVFVNNGITVYFTLKAKKIKP